MKYIILFGAALTLAFCGTAQVKSLQINADRNTEELFGAVKSVKIETALLEKDEDNWREGERHPSGSVVFDEFGFKIEDLTFYAPDFAASQKLINKYDKDNRIITIEIEGEGKRDYSYKPDKKQIEEVATTKDGAVLYKTIYTFDEKGNNILREYLEVDKKFAQSFPAKITNKFNAQNQLSETAYFNADETKTTIPNSEVHKVVVSYDKSKASQKSFLKVDDGLFGRFVYNYDENGNLAITTQFNSASVLENKTMYSNFDKAGNWQKKLTEGLAETDNQGVVALVQVAYRTITYF